MKTCKYYSFEGSPFCRESILMDDLCLYKDNWILCSRYEPEDTPEDIVNHPSHYTKGNYECIDVIFDVLDQHSDPVSAWLTGQIIKYIWRWPFKGGVQDLKKIRFYLDKLIEYEEGKGAPV